MLHSLRRAMKSKIKKSPHIWADSVMDETELSPTRFFPFCANTGIEIEVEGTLDIPDTL